MINSCFKVFSRCFIGSSNPNNEGGSRQTIGDVSPAQTVNQSATQEQPAIGGVGATCRPKQKPSPAFGRSAQAKAAGEVAIENEDQTKVDVRGEDGNVTTAAEEATIQNSDISSISEMNIQDFKKQLAIDFKIIKDGIEKIDINSNSCTHVAIRSIPKESYNDDSPPKDLDEDEPQSIEAGIPYVRNAIKEDDFPAISFSINPSYKPLEKVYAYNAVLKTGGRGIRDAVIIMPLPGKDVIDLIKKWKDIKKFIKNNTSVYSQEKLSEISKTIDRCTHISKAYRQDAMSKYVKQSDRIKLKSDENNIDLNLLLEQKTSVRSTHSEVFLKFRPIHPKIYVVKLETPEGQEEMRGRFAGYYQINKSFDQLEIIETIESSSVDSGAQI